MGKATILVVDDDAYIRDALQAVLQDEGFSVVTCDDGWPCLEILMSTKIDMVLLDFMMPGLAGDEVIHAIRTSNQPWANVPIVLMSGTVQLSDLHGINAFLRKPFSAEQLLETLSEAPTRKPSTAPNRLSGKPASSVKPEPDKK